VSLRGRLERLEARAKPRLEPPPRSERRERAFERLFRTLDALSALVESTGPLPWDDPRPRAIIQRHQDETREQKGDPDG
jgi:3-methyladenine DNA glycosylase/8-oxoguanine DNA glycosylase